MAVGCVCRYTFWLMLQLCISPKTACALRRALVFNSIYQSQGFAPLTSLELAQVPAHLLP